ncbi:hypothetical protein [Pseudoalteromonas sp. T1lg23B]|uniref:hypothetical protein n=1 Tax=Pseudoalteromonas sp. T1lg23B TaxID=2077097 RepID=UPI000CF6EC77|nr:hypothetical protein [Pseudoalteromonas sp. T1lg23B]
MSNDMHSTLNNWVQELESETEIVSSEEINEEANSNMVSFGFNDTVLNDWGKDSVQEFIESCAELYERKSMGISMVFYSWFDEMAGQIRISAVSQTHGKLPFRCKVNPVKLSEIVNGIYSDDSGLYTRGELDVWCKNI